VTGLEQLRRLWNHAEWADAALLGALQRQGGGPVEALREYAHVLGAEEVWLSRLEGRPPRAAVWPEPVLAELPGLARSIRAGFAAYLATLTEGDLGRGIAYVNSAGLAFTTPVEDILLQVALHGQYHRGKVNLLLRQAGLEPVPADFIGFVRGVPAATTADARGASR
jgi:uncharacterized damage-inducible protein DinB